MGILRKAGPCLCAVEIHEGRADRETARRRIPKCHGGGCRKPVTKNAPQQNGARKKMKVRIKKPEDSVLKKIEYRLGRRSVVVDGVFVTIDNYSWQSAADWQAWIARLG